MFTTVCISEWFAFEPRVFISRPISWDMKRVCFLPVVFHCFEKILHGFQPYFSSYIKLSKIIISCRTSLSFPPRKSSGVNLLRWNAVQLEFPDSGITVSNWKIFPTRLFPERIPLLGSWSFGTTFTRSATQVGNQFPPGVRAHWKCGAS